MLKKILALCLITCLLFSATALAEFPQQPDVELEGGSTTWTVLTDADRLVKQVDGGQILCDMQGNVLSDIVFRKIIDNPKYIEVTLSDGMYGLDGIIDLNGKELVPAEFDHVSMDGDWAFAVLFGDGSEEDYDIRARFDGVMQYKVYETVCIYNLLTGECVDVIEGRNFNRLNTYNGYANVSYRDGTVIAYDPAGSKLSVQPRSVYDTTHVPVVAATGWDTVYDSDTELYALADANGNQVTEAQYYSISVTMANCYGAHYFEIEDQDGHVGLLYESGEIVVPMAYEEIWTVANDYTAGNTFAASTEGVFSLICDGEAVDFPMNNFESYNITFLGTGALVNTNEDKWELLNADGSVQALPDNLGNFYARFIDGKAYLICVENDDQYRGLLMDDQGNILLSGTDNSSRIHITSGGHVVVVNDNAIAVYSLK